MNVLVLGGRGSIGAAVCMQLLQRGHAQRVLSRGGVEPEHPLDAHTDWAKEAEKVTHIFRMLTP